MKVDVAFTCLGKIIKTFGSLHDFLISNTYSNEIQFIDYVILSTAVNR